MEDQKMNAGGASAATAQDASTTAAKQPIPYAASGETFTNWANRRISEHGNVRIPLGTKHVRVNRLLPDGRLEVEVPDADGATAERQFVAFDATMLDLLLPKLAKI